MPPSLRVMVVGDSQLRRLLAVEIARHDRIDLAATAPFGADLAEKVAVARPDLIALELDLDGKAIAHIVELRRLGIDTPVLAMDRGPLSGGRAAALAQVHTSVVSVPHGLTEVAAATVCAPVLAVLTLRASARNGRSVRVEKAPVVTRVRAAAKATTAGAPRTGRARAPHVLAIGVSTGGPKALATVLPQLPADFPLPVLVVQHMPAGFTESLATSLDQQSHLRVAQAIDGEPLVSGRVYVAPGGRHMGVRRRNGLPEVYLSDGPLENSCRPAVDFLFRSLRQLFGGSVLGVLMTGMGEDGHRTSRDLYQDGATILAQDQASSTVYGMPRKPIEEGFAEAVPLAALAGRILELSVRQPGG